MPGNDLARAVRYGLNTDQLRLRADTIALPDGVTDAFIDALNDAVEGVALIRDREGIGRWAFVDIQKQQDIHIPLAVAAVVVALVASGNAKVCPPRGTITVGPDGEEHREVHIPIRTTDPDFPHRDPCRD